MLGVPCVEDLQSGVEALCRGWRRSYLTIVGAVGRHTPEDVARVFTQRGAWAIDTVRFSIWRPRLGFNLRQRLRLL